MYPRIAGFALLVLLIGLAAEAPAPIRAGESAQGGDAERGSRGVGRVHVDDVYAGRGGNRQVEVYVRALTKYGESIRGITATDVTAYQDDQKIPAEELSVRSLKRTGQGMTVVLAIDASGTMSNEDRFGGARDAAVSFIDLLAPEDRVAVLSFAEEVHEIVTFDFDREAAKEAVRRLRVIQEERLHTRLYDGVHRAIDMIRSQPDLPRRSFILLLSDGKDDSSDHSAAQIVREARGEGADAHILIFPVHYATLGVEGLPAMEELAEGTGGQTISVSSITRVLSFFDAIASQIMWSFVLQFPASLDGEEHEIRVVIDRQSGSRSVTYPYVRGPIWPWVGGAVGVVVVLAIAVLLLRLRSPGTLRVVSGPRAGESVPLRGGKTRIGALDDNDIVLPSDVVSRYHAEIVARGRGAEIRDLRSKNGTRINGQPVQQANLSPGDKILIADVELIYER